MAILTTSRQATADELAAEMDRRGAVIEKLEARIAELMLAADRAKTADVGAVLEELVRDLYGIANQVGDTYGTDERPDARDYPIMRECSKEIARIANILAAIPPAEAINRARTFARIMLDACDRTEAHRKRDAVIVPTAYWHKLMDLAAEVRALASKEAPDA